MIDTMFFAKSREKPIAILIPKKDFKKDHIQQYYVEPLKAQGIPAEDIMAISIDLNPQGRAPVSMIKPCMEQVELLAKGFKITRLMVCQSNYFKYITKQKKVEVNYGYPIKSPLLPDIVIFASISYSTLFVKPNYHLYLQLSLKALTFHVQGKNHMFVHSILDDIHYPETLGDIQTAVNRLYKYPVLSCDIETLSLQVDKAGIGTIAFAWNETDGIAFRLLDRKEAKGIRKIIKNFLVKYTGKLIYHGSTFDIKVLIWELFMEHPMDIEGMLKGLDILFRNMEDTKTLAYLATNTTTGNSLSLKQQAFEYAGNYAVESIGDIRKIKPSELLEYNLVDAVCTWFVFNKHRSTVQGHSEIIYQYLFKPALKVITQMELVGMPLNLQKVKEAEKTLTTVVAGHMSAIQGSPILPRFIEILKEDAVEQANKKLKKLRKTVADFPDIEFNPGSTKQMRMLLFDHLDLPPQTTTHTGLPSVDDKTLQRLIVHPKVKILAPVVDLLNHIAELGKASKILNTFIPAFLHKNTEKDGWYYLLGSFNLGGTLSGRLSSSDPNLMNIPATGTKYAKLVKECFQAPFGWVFIGADFSSLEDRISALQTKDPQKLKIYIGHTKFDLNIDGVVHHIYDNAIIDYDGKQLTAQEFYDTYSEFRE